MDGCGTWNIGPTCCSSSKRNNTDQEATQLDKKGESAVLHPTRLEVQRIPRRIAASMCIDHEYFRVNVTMT